jgi:hypothetical protein
MDVVYKPQENLSIKVHPCHSLLFENNPNSYIFWNKSTEFMFGNAKL